MPVVFPDVSPTSAAGGRVASDRTAGVQKATTRRWSWWPVATFWAVWLGLGSGQAAAAESETDRPRGVLAIESTPTDAAVVVDGNDAGRTPYQQPALVGTHSVILNAAGYLPQKVSISVAEARTSRLDILLVSGNANSTDAATAKPIYKKAWFWVVVGGAAVAVAAVATGVVLSQNSGPTEPPHALNHIVF